MAQSGKSGGGASPPFATPGGKPSNQGTTSGGGGFDFLKDPTSKEGATKPADLIAEGNRPQPAYKALPGLPNAESIPAGGKILMADPGPVSKAANSAGGGVAVGVQGAATPFKNLK
jgi:hypothetical protein